MWQRGLTDEARSGTTRGRGGQPQEAEEDNHKGSLTAGGDSISSDYHGHLTNASCLFVLCTRKTYLVSRRITFFSKSVGLAKDEYTNLEKDFML